ncbi:putative lipopolysaccharide heptosyltransferase III [Nitratifractor sp.]
MKILVCKFMHIGDVLLITPLLENLKLHFPDAHIDVALNEGTEAMITDNPHVRTIHAYPRSRIKALPIHRRILAEWRYARTIRNERYDILINLNSTDRGLLIAAVSKAKTVLSHPSAKNRWLNRFIDHPLPKIDRKHWVDIHLDPLRVLGIEPMHKRVSIYWDASVDQAIHRRMEHLRLKSGGFIHFHPVSRWFFKCIDDRLSARIIDFCQEEMKLPVVLTAAPDEREKEKIRAILRHTRTRPIDLSGQLTLKETAALNKHARAYIGVDTAIMHISAANDTPVLAFFGPSIPYAWGPWDNGCIHSGYTSLRGNQRMGKHRILQKDWDCVACDDRGCANQGISACLYQWDEAEIYQAIREMIR